MSNRSWLKDGCGEIEAAINWNCRRDGGVLGSVIDRSDVLILSGLLCLLSVHVVESAGSGLIAVAIVHLLMLVF